MINEVEDVEEDTPDEGLLDSTKSNTAAPTSYITKSVNVELAAGRFVRFISPDGVETIVLAGRADRFRKVNKVNGKWKVL